MKINSRTFIPIVRFVYVTNFLTCSSFLVLFLDVDYSCPCRDHSITMATTASVGSYFLEEDNVPTDPREQAFHNMIREYLIVFLILLALYGCSYALISTYKRKKDEVWFGMFMDESRRLRMIFLHRLLAIPMKRMHLCIGSHYGCVPFQWPYQLEQLSFFPFPSSRTKSSFCTRTIITCNG